MDTFKMRGKKVSVQCCPIYWPISLSDWPSCLIYLLKNKEKHTVDGSHQDGCSQETAAQRNYG